MNPSIEKINIPKSIIEKLGMENRTEDKMIETLLEYDPQLEYPLSKSLAEHSNTPFIRLEGKAIPAECFCAMPEGLLKKHKMIPFAKSDTELHVAFENPYPPLQYEDLHLYHSGRIVPYIATRREIIQRIEKHYRKNAIEKLLPKNIAVKEKDGGDYVHDPTVRLVNSFIGKGIQERASDIHIEPKEEDLVIRFRINGDLIEYDRMEKNALSKIVTRIKVIGKIEIIDSQKCQDGKFEFVFGAGKRQKVDIRVSIIPTIFGEKVVLRVLNRHGISLVLGQLGFSKEQLVQIQNLLQYSSGMVLCCGPTGSGKSTTLYSMIDGIKHQNLNVTSIEDPVEYKIPTINQILVNEKAHITFANTLKYVLRQDPDVIMIGEIRDRETVDLAIRASITGHLVLSTLHTKNAVSTISRLLDMGVEPYYINAALSGIIAQRLVKKICPECIEPYYPTEEETSVFNEIKGIQLYYGKGCEQCNYTGSQERLLVAEVLVLNSSVKALVSKDFAQERFEQEISKIHKDTLQLNCKKLLFEGLISLEEFKQFVFMGYQ